MESGDEWSDRERGRADEPGQLAPPTPEPSAAPAPQLAIPLAPTPLVSDRVLVLLTLALAVMVLLSVVAAVLAWHAPPLHPVAVPSVARA